jgi:hypothetical protein
MERPADVVTICDLKLLNSSPVSRKAKSSGNRALFRVIAWFNAFVVTPVKLREIGIEHDFLAANMENQLGELFRGWHTGTEGVF